MARRIALVVAVVTVALFGVAGAAQASIITLNVDFTASGFQAGAPVDPVTGSVSVTFDNTSFAQVDQTSGISVTNLNIALTDPPGFDYNPGSDSLTIGGVGTGCVNAGCVMVGTNDFAMTLINVSTNPTFLSFLYSQAGTTSAFFTTTGTPVPAGAVPEPASLALVMLGFAGLGARRWQKRRT